MEMGEGSNTHKQIKRNKMPTRTIKAYRTAKKVLKNHQDCVKMKKEHIPFLPSNS